MITKKNHKKEKKVCKIKDIFECKIKNDTQKDNEKIIKIFDTTLNYDFINRNEVIRLLNSLYFTKEATKIVLYDLKIGHFSFIKSESDLLDIVKKRFTIFNKKAINKFCKELSRDKQKAFKESFKIIIKDIILNIRMNNQIDIFSVEIDPFKKETEIIREGAKVRLIKHKIHFNKFESLVENLDVEKKKNYINDFNQHFPMFLDFLDFIVACRFAKSRRKSYLYMRVDAGFGKSLLMSILKRIGVAMNVELNQLKSNSASELHPTEFLNSICLCVDEFTHFSQELKVLTNQIQISAKFSLRTELEVYAKIFFSAEKSTSFFSEAGVDEQLADRVSLIDIENINKLDDRDLYKNNKSQYIESLYEFIYKYLTTKINIYLQNDKLTSANIAENFLDNFNSKYKIKADNIQKIKDVIFEALREFTELKENHQELKSKYHLELNQLIFLRNDDNIIIKNPTKLYELIIKEQSQSFYKNAIYKQTQLDSIFGIDLKNRKTIRDRDSKPIFGYLINLTEYEIFDLMGKKIIYKSKESVCAQINFLLNHYYKAYQSLDSQSYNIILTICDKLQLSYNLRKDTKDIIELFISIPAN